jgi:hypothetical protein
MKKAPLKLWCVSREVLARNLQEAIRKPGRVYLVQEAAKEYQPESKLTIGYGTKKSKKIK